MPDSTLSGARPIVIVQADTRDSRLHASGTGSDDARRPDFVLIRDALDAQILDLNDVAASKMGRLVRMLAGPYPALAVMAFRRRRRATAYITGSENEAIVLALLLKLARGHKPIVAVGVYPAKPQKWLFWRQLRLHSHIYRIMPLGTVQAERLVHGLGVPPNKVEVLPYGVDTDFWVRAKATPNASAGPYFFAAGLQHRDYRTLVAAADGLGVGLVIAAASLWSKSDNDLQGLTLPPWVTVQPMDYSDLRDAYAGALAVVAPAIDTDMAPGMTSILEGMSMGRPVIASRAEGNGDYVADRRRVLRKGPHRATSAALATRLASVPAQGQTGFYVPPGDVSELKSVLQWILDHPREAEAIGARGRVVAEEVHSLENYVGRIVAAVRQGVAEQQDHA